MSDKKEAGKEKEDERIDKIFTYFAKVEAMERFWYAQAHQYCALCGIHKFCDYFNKRDTEKKLCEKEYSEEIQDMIVNNILEFWRKK